MLEVKETLFKTDNKFAELEKKVAEKTSEVEVKAVPQWKKGRGGVTGWANTTAGWANLGWVKPHPKSIRRFKSVYRRHETDSREIRGSVCDSTAVCPFCAIHRLRADQLIYSVLNNQIIKEFRSKINSRSPYTGRPKRRCSRRSSGAGCCIDFA